MVKRIYILFLVLLISNTLFGQFVGKDNVSKALFYLQKTELDSAKKYIDEAALVTEENSLPKTWYYRGFIYKEMYKTKEKENKKSPSRLVAIDALKKLLVVDATKEFTESSIKMLKYLASTLYNDAARSLNPEKYDVAQGNYNLYRQAMLVVNPSLDLKDQDVRFKLALASLFNRESKEVGVIDSVSSVKAKQIYMEVLVLDTNNGSANYNLGILNYNEAVSLINKMDYDMDLEKLNEVQDICIDLFLKALPYMKKSYELQWKRKETLIGLSNIYYGLNDMEKSEAYKKELEELEAGQ